jgi:8-oxo-dGTP pyrophosphatase MutT (NUDIX family)
VVSPVPLGRDESRADAHEPLGDPRRQVHRRAARVLVLDHTDRILLFLDSDLGLDPVPHWWITPGGGVDPGEEDVAAAVRELWEETGLRLAASDLIGPMAVRHVVHGYSDQVTHQDEVYFAVRVPAFTIDTSGHTEEERLTVAGVRWWTREDLTASPEDRWPRTLDAIWSLVERPDSWARGPVALETVEESTVPA